MQSFGLSPIAVQVNFTKRYSHGLSITSNYTFQKEEVLGTETQNPAFQVASPIIDLDNLAVNKSLSVPHRFVFAGNYITPRANVYRPLSWPMRDWNFGAYLVYQSGLPIMSPVATNYPYPYQELSLSQADVHYGLFGVAFPGASFMSRVPGQSLYAQGIQDLNSYYNPFTTTVLNSAAWQNPRAGQCGTGSAYYNDYRLRGAPTENLSLARIFRIREGINLQFRIELENAFNRTHIPAPETGVVIPGIFGNANFAGMAVSAGGERTGQVYMRFNL